MGGAAPIARYRVKGHILDAAWHVFVFVLAVGACIIRIRQGETWAPAGLILLAAMSYSNFNDAASKMRAERKGRANARA